MNPNSIFSFSAKIDIIGINPFVFLPDDVLQGLMLQANKTRGPIPVKGEINDCSFLQTLVKYKGHWRLYLNTPMRSCSKTDVGDWAHFVISFDDKPRETPMHPKLEKALNENEKAQTVYLSLAPSLQKEIKRYINHLKTEESVDRNILYAIQFLLGEKRWIGREKPE